MMTEHQLVDEVVEMAACIGTKFFNESLIF
jgi:hypothetical protein